MIFERKRLEIGIKIGAQFEQRLQSNLHEKVIRDAIENPPEQLNYDECETENRMSRASSEGESDSCELELKDMRVSPAMNAGMRSTINLNGQGLSKFNPIPTKREKQTRKLFGPRNGR